jgi:hypothetical protein
LLPGYVPSSLSLSGIQRFFRVSINTGVWLLPCKAGLPAQSSLYIVLNQDLAVPFNSRSLNMLHLDLCLPVAITASVLLSEEALM